MLCLLCSITTSCDEEVLCNYCELFVATFSVKYTTCNHVALLHKADLRRYYSCIKIGGFTIVG